MAALLDDLILSPTGDAAARPAWSASRWRWRLGVGGALTVAVAAVIAPAPQLAAGDADLLTLLRGMALIKAAIVAGLVSLLWWRLQWPMTAARAWGYLGTSWTLCAATVLIWQLASVAIAATLFHVALLALLLLAWRDVGARRGRAT